MSELTEKSWKEFDSEHTIIEVVWRSGGIWGTIGFVAVHNTKMNYWSAYTGLANNKSENEDAISIAESGGFVTSDIAAVIFPNIKNEFGKYKK